MPALHTNATTTKDEVCTVFTGDSNGEDVGRQHVFFKTGILSMFRHTKGLWDFSRVGTGWAVKHHQ